MKFSKWIFIVISVLMFHGCVETNQFASLENRVAAIEMENIRNREKNVAQSREAMAEIDKKLSQGRVITKEEWADTLYEIKSLKSEVQQLRGMIETQAHSFSSFAETDYVEMEKMLERTDLAVSKNYERLIALEKYMGFEPTANVQKPDNAEITAPVQSENAEQALYALAKKMFDEGDLANARIRFENFINKYPKSTNADNARFWIADSFYAEKWFEKAILEYQKVLDDYPDSNKLAAARLKQGYAFAQLGETANARLLLKELIKKHPGSNEAKYAAEKLKSLTPAND